MNYLLHGKFNNNFLSTLNTYLSTPFPLDPFHSLMYVLDPLSSQTGLVLLIGRTHFLKWS